LHAAESRWDGVARNEKTNESERRGKKKRGGEGKSVVFGHIGARWSPGRRGVRGEGGKREEKKTDKLP